MICHTPSIVGYSGGDSCWRLGGTSAEGTSVERHRREDRGAKGAEGGTVRRGGVPSPLGEGAASSILCSYR